MTNGEQTAVRIRGVTGMGWFEQDIRDNIAAAMEGKHSPAVRPAGEQRGAERTVQNASPAENGEKTNPLLTYRGQYDEFAQRYGVYGGEQNAQSEQTAQRSFEPVTAQTVLRELARTLRRTDRLLVTD